MVKRIIFVATVFILSITAFSNPIHEKNYTGLKVSDFDQYTITLHWNLSQFNTTPVDINNINYSKLYFDNCEYTSEMNRPEIPFKKFALGIPDNAKIQYSLTNIKYETIPNTLPIPVGQPYKDKTGITSVKRSVNSENYNFQSQQAVEFSEQQYFKNLPVVYCKFYPVSYNYNTRTIKYIKSADIQITFKPENILQSNTTISKYLQKMYNAYVINYAQAKHWTIAKNKYFKKTSVISQGPWYKIEVTEDGLYKILPSTLSNAGINVSSIDPRTFQLFNNGGKPLNRNALATENNPTEPVENAIYVNGENDGSFDSGDYILFYGTKLGGWNYSSSKNDFVYIQHPYDRKNYYWLTFGNSTGKRIEQIPQTTLSATSTESYFWRRVHFEDELTNLLSSGADWYGHRFFGTSAQASFNYQLNNLSATANPAKLVVRLKGGSAILYADNSSYIYYFTTYLNPTMQPNALIPSTLLRSTPYTAQNDNDYLLLDQTFNSTDYLVNGQNTLTLDYIGSSESCNAYLDFVEFYYPGDFTATNDYLDFYTNTTGQVVNFNVNNYTAPTVKLFDISDPTNIKELLTNGVQNNTLSFKVDLTDNSQHKFIASSLNSSEISTVSSVTLFEPTKNLFDPSLNGELIVITPPNYMNYGNEIVSLRNSGLNPITGVVVNTEDIYFYFGSGVKDPTAIRNFIRHAYNNWTIQPKYVLLFGDGHYDYRNISVSDTNFIPPYEISHSYEIDSRESDIYYVDINNTSTSLNSMTDDLGVGRLPVESHLDARRVVDKLVSYEQSKSHDGWQTVLTFVADDTNPDGITFQVDSDIMARQRSIDKFLKRKIYLTAYNSVPGGFGRVKPEANNDIIDQINEGTLFINFVGHGSSQVWAHENVFEMNRDLNRIQNEGKLSIFIAATCTFGKYDNPLDPSFTEALIWRENSGAIGVIAASRAVYNSSNVNFNTNFYNRLFPGGTASERLGDAYMLSTSNSSNYQKFHLFADPSMFPADPRNLINIDPVTLNNSDTLKALGKVNFSGIVNKDSSIWQSFTGGATVIVNDAMFENVNTGGNHIYSMNGPRIFKGEVSINNGSFASEFIVPKSIRYQNAKTGRVTIYAWNEQGSGDALGYVDTLLFYGTTNLIDEDGPEVDLYFEGQEQFNDGDLVSDNPTLIAEIADENGINLTQEVGHTIEIQIDDETSKDVTTFFSYERDSYSEGKLKYHLEDLNEGIHQLSVKAWDNLNNPTTKLINFQVVQNNGIVLRNVVNYPNPFNSETYFTFQSLGSSGAEVIVKIYTISGRLIKTIEGHFVNNDGFTKIHWDGRDDDGDEIANGVYPYKLILKNGNDSKEKIEKLVVLK